MEVEETCLRFHCSIKLRILHSQERKKLHLKLRAAAISGKKVAPQDACWKQHLKVHSVTVYTCCKYNCKDSIPVGKHQHRVLIPFPLLGSESFNPSEICKRGYGIYTTCMPLHWIDMTVLGAASLHASRRSASGSTECEWEFAATVHV